MTKLTDKGNLECDTIGSTSISHFAFLNGRELDEVALSFIHALRPSKVRVVFGSVKADACNWRVTIYLYSMEDRRIKEITQEVEVGLPDDCENSDELWARLEKQNEHCYIGR